MEKKYELHLSTGIVAFSDNRRALADLAKSADLDHEGQLGWELMDSTTGEVLDYQKKGMDITLYDLSEKMELISVRLYNVTLRHLMEITGRDIEDILHNISMRDIRDMVFGGKFVNVRNMGGKCRKEFYDLLIKFCGNTHITRLAINVNINLHNRDFFRRNPGATDNDVYDNKITQTYKADLSEPYYSEHYN